MGLQTLMSNNQHDCTNWQLNINDYDTRTKTTKIIIMSEMEILY